MGAVVSCVSSSLLPPPQPTIITTTTTTQTNPPSFPPRPPDQIRLPIHRRLPNGHRARHRLRIPSHLKRHRRRL